MTTVQVKVKVDPEEIRTELVRVLKIGNGEDILNYFVSDDKRIKKIVSSLIEESRNQLVDFIEKGKFIKEEKNKRYYQYSSSTGEIFEFEMINIEGVWKFVIF